VVGCNFPKSCASGAGLTAHQHSAVSGAVDHATSRQDLSMIGKGMAALASTD